MDIEKIIEAYRAGDEGDRVRLFLAFRDLRDHFSRIEQESPNDDIVLVRFPWTRKDRLERAA